MAAKTEPKTEIYVTLCDLVLGGYTKPIGTELTLDPNAQSTKQMLQLNHIAAKKVEEPKPQ
jgi:hypothetical protein